MRIADILKIDSDGREAADLFMMRLANAFTRHGDVKGLLHFGNPEDYASYEEPVAGAQTDSDAAVSAGAPRLTRNYSQVPVRCRARRR